MARDRVGTLIGVYSCWSCTQEVPVREKAADAGGKLSAPCPWCGFKHYADRGTKHFAKLMKEVRPIDAKTAAALGYEPLAAEKTETAAAPAAAAAATSSSAPAAAASSSRPPFFLGGGR